MSKITNEFRNHALRRGIIIKSGKGTVAKNVAYAGFVELANLGFIADPAELMSIGQTALVETIKEARSVMGADRDMTPVYPGFPKQVQELDTMTLLVEQILHYWTAGTFLPNHPTIAREGLPLEDMLRGARELRVLSASQVAHTLSVELTNQSIAMSVADKELLAGAIALSPVREVGEVIRDSKNGENIQSLLLALSKNGNYSHMRLLLTTLENTSQVDVALRAVLALFSKPSGEKWKDNYELAVHNLSDANYRAVRMFNIPRSVRRALVEKLGETTKGYNADRLVNRQNLWRKVMSAVHPYDFDLNDAQKRAMDIIHSNVEYRTLNSVIEEAMEKGDANTAITVTAKHQPGNLLRRAVALLRIVKSDEDAKLLAKAIKAHGSKAQLTTLISAYNGILSANDTNARVTRVAGRNNTMVDRKDTAPVNKKHVKKVAKAVLKSMEAVLATKTAPTGKVGILSSIPVPLVRRDASTADRELARGEIITLAGTGDTLRVFTHWNNNMSHSGYMDTGAVILDEDCNHLATISWDSWSKYRDFATYSGDKLVYPGDHASEFFDLDLNVVRKKYPTATMIAMTIISYTGWKTNEVDIIAGAMLRSDADKGEVFDARTVATAFKPSTSSTQSIPLVVKLDSGEMVWVDSDNGSTRSNYSATEDTTIGSVIYDELIREKLTLGKLAESWAKAHGAETVNEPVDKEALLNLL